MLVPQISAFFESSLASSMSAAATSFTLASGTDRDGNALSGLYGFVIDPDTSDREYVIGSVSGTTVTVTYRGIDADAPNTEIAGNKKAHRRGAIVKISDYPILGVLRNLLNGTDTIPNKLSYASHPTFSGNTELVDKQYVDGLAFSGAPDASTTVKGLAEEATQAEVEAGTAAGGTAARLFVNPSTLPDKTGYGYAADAGSTDTYAITLAPVPTAYTAGMRLRFKANTRNTGACTINVNTLGAKAIKKDVSLDLADGDIEAGGIYELVYDGTNFQMINPKGSVPTGSMFMWGTASAPTGYLLCDGTAVSRTTYATLFAVIGTAFGTGDGSTTFNLPDFRGRGPMGKNAGTFSALGATGGEETHTLTTSEMPAHTHTEPGSDAGASNNTTRFALGANGGNVTNITSSSTGGGAAHNVLDPYLVVNFVIKT
jgi:microcystin-dependent protein